MSSPSTVPLRVLFEDYHLIVVDKPAGLVVHPGTGHEHGLVELVRAELVARHGPSRHWAGVAPVHRLDKDTSGVVVFGKTEAGLRKMARLFESGEVEKTYLVLCRGITHKKGRIDVPLLARPRVRERQARAGVGQRTDTEEMGGARERIHGEKQSDAEKQEAVTRYRRLIQVPGLSLLVVQPESGRTHQIRRHLRALGHPVAGDLRWGDPRFNRFVQQHGLDRPFIHAAVLSFVHPLSGETLTLRSPLPPELRAVLANLGFVPLRPPWVEAESLESEGESLT